MVQLDHRVFERFFGEGRNLRIYRISGIPRGGVGAGEFHKHRSEIITIENGMFMLALEDIRGRVKTVTLPEGVTYGIVGPFILHTYTALTSRASLHVVANTLYDHKRPATQDTYSQQDFRELQAALKSHSRIR
jgi:hypothetical protein